MSTLIQKLHPALYPGRRLGLAGSRQPLFSRQGMWDSGSALHCAAMALAMLGKLSDPVDVRGYASGPVAHFWDRAWPHYLHGLTPSELVSFVWELDAGVQPVECEGSADEILRFCAGELAAGWPVIVWIVNRRTGERHRRTWSRESKSGTPSPRHFCCLIRQAPCRYWLRATRGWNPESLMPRTSRPKRPCRQTWTARCRSADRKMALAKPAASDLGRRRRVGPTLAGRRERHPVQRREQLGERDAQHMADVGQRFDGRIGDAALDRRDICPVHMGLEGQRLLRLVGLMPALLDALAEGNGDRGRGVRRG